MVGRIYGLTADDGRIRYVGQTTRKLSIRLKNHIDRASLKRTRAQCWVHAKLNAGETIHIVLIEECSLNDLNSREIYWIAEYRKTTPDLTNQTDGGTGGNTFGGRTHTPETRAKLSASKRGKKPSQKNLDAVAAGWARQRNIPTSCLTCRREFQSKAGFSSHYASVHKQGNAKRSDAMKKAWAHGKYPPKPKSPPPSVCSRGHVLDEKNLWVSSTGSGSWCCRPCHNAATQARRRARRMVKDQ